MWSHIAVGCSISIHAPAKGATQTISVATATQVISIHAPAKGATKDSGISATSSKFQSTLPRRERLNEGFALNNLQSDFNPRSREGSDKFAFPTNEDDIISIHAPAKGATIPPMTFTKLIMPFQSTLPRRERLRSSNRRSTPTTNFNPRSREGSDNSSGNKMDAIIKFQSTLPRRERQGTGAISKV